MVYLLDCPLMYCEVYYDNVECKLLCTMNGNYVLEPMFHGIYVSHWWSPPCNVFVTVQFVFSSPQKINCNPVLIAINSARHTRESFAFRRSILTYRSKPYIVLNKIDYILDARYTNYNWPKDSLHQWCNTSNSARVLYTCRSKRPVLSNGGGLDLFLHVVHANLHTCHVI